MSTTFRFPEYEETLNLLCQHDARPQDFLRLAYQYAWTFSHDPKTKNGSVLITKSGRLFYGCNHLPRGIEVTDEIMSTPALKDPLITHAEVDVIMKAARAGVSTQDSVMFCCWAPCVPCASRIIEAGVGTLIVHKQMHMRTYEKYLASIETAIGYLKRARVAYEAFDGYIGGCQGLMSNEVWEP